MKGRRLPLYEFPKLPGDYMGPVMGYTADLFAVFFLKPNAFDIGAPRRARAIQHVVCPPHRFRECSDGSLEIRESLSDRAGGGGDSDGWHGYLDEGHIWRRV